MKSTEILCRAERDCEKIIKIDKYLQEELEIWSDKDMKTIKTTRSWYNKLSETVKIQRYKVSTDASTSTVLNERFIGKKVTSTAI